MLILYKQTQKKRLQPRRRLPHRGEYSLYICDNALLVSSTPFDFLFRVQLLCLFLLRPISSWRKMEGSNARHERQTHNEERKKETENFVIWMKCVISMCRSFPLLSFSSFFFRLERAIICARNVFLKNWISGSFDLLNNFLICLFFLQSFTLWVPLRWLIDHHQSKLAPPLLPLSTLRQMIDSRFNSIPCKTTRTLSLTCSLELNSS